MRKSPMSPPTRGPEPVRSGTTSPMIATVVSVGVSSVPPLEMLVSVVAVSVNWNDPMLRSGKDQLTVQTPAGGMSMSAADTVRMSAATWGSANPIGWSAHVISMETLPWSAFTSSRNTS